MLLARRSLALPRGRWLRRLAALCCLLIAAFSTTSAKHPKPARAPDRLAPGQLAVPVRVLGSDLHAYLVPGARVDLISQASDTYGTAPPASSHLVAEDVVVLRIIASPDSIGAAPAGSNSELIVAVDPAEALRIAQCSEVACLAAAREAP